MEIYNLGVDDPVPFLADEVERERGELEDVDYETADDEAEYEHQNHYLPPLYPLHDFPEHLHLLAVLDTACKV